MSQLAVRTYPLKAVLLFFGGGLAAVVSILAVTLFPEEPHWALKALIVIGVFIVWIAYVKILLSKVVIVPEGQGFVVLNFGAFVGILWNAPGMVEIVEDGTSGTSIVSEGSLWIPPKTGACTPETAVSQCSRADLQAGTRLMYLRMDGSYVMCRVVCVDRTVAPFIGNHYFIGIFSSVEKFPVPLSYQDVALKFEGQHSGGGPRVKFILPIMVRMVNVYRAAYVNNQGHVAAQHYIRSRISGAVGASDTSAFVQSLIDFGQPLTAGLEREYGMDFIIRNPINIEFSDPDTRAAMHLPYQAEQEAAAMVERAKGEAARIYAHSIAHTKRIEMMAETLKRTGKEGELAATLATLEKMGESSILFGDLAKFFANLKR